MLFANIHCHYFSSETHCPCNTKSVCLLLKTKTAHHYAKLPMHSMSNNWNELDNEVNRIVERMKDLEMKRDADIEATRFMTSLPECTHSYGKFALCKKSEFNDFALDIKS